MVAAGVLVGQLLVDTRASHGITVLAVVLLVAAAPLIGLPFWHLSRYGEPASGHPYYATTCLVDRGVYRLVRHPQYVGYILLVGGFALLHPHPVILGLAAGSALLFVVQAIREERFCRAKWPASYEAYVRRVPRFNVLSGAIRFMRENVIRGRN